ncbi:MAG: glutamyl-tRNA reductase [Chloroflexota bacterium]
MHIYAVSLNHRVTPLHLRERFAFDEAAICTALSHTTGRSGDSPFAETVVLSTCNRTEIYAASERPEIEALVSFLAAQRAVQPKDICPYLVAWVDADAARHLFQVTAGLDSLVLGEPQILGQVTRAFELARGAGAAGGVLARLFQAAIHAGKRARAETGISRNPASVASLAANLCERHLASLGSARVAVIGAGEMAELSIEALRKRGVQSICVVNRTFERARALAERWQAEVVAFDALGAAVSDADILIASTGSPHAIVSAEMVAAAMRRRPERPLVLIDIAVPRDIAPDVAALPGVSLFDLDQLNANLEQSLAERQSEVPHVQAILEEEIGRFLDVLQTQAMLPLIANLRQRAEAIRRTELARTLRSLPGLTDAEQKRIDAMTQALVKKLLDAPTQRLRQEANCPHAPAYATVARTLFGLSTKDDVCSFTGKACPADAFSTKP